MNTVSIRTALAIGGGGVIARIWRWCAVNTGRHVALGRLEGSVIGVVETIEQFLEPIYTGGYYLLCGYILFELRSEILACIRVLAQVVLWVCDLAGSVYSVSLRRFGAGAEAAIIHRSEAEHPWKTCQFMAFEGFLLLERSGEWDEVYAAGVVPDSSDLIVRTTDEEGSDWIWSVVRCVATAIKAPVGAGAQRAAPPGVAAGSVNWICNAQNNKWNPNAAEIQALKQEAGLLGLNIKRVGLADNMVTIPGMGMCLIPLNLQGQAGGAPVARVPQGDPGGLGPVQGPGPAGDGFNLQSLTDVINELRDMAKRKDSGKSDKKKKKKTKSRKSKKKKKKRSSSSTSRSSRSRSSRSSSSSSSRSSQGPLRWRQKGKDKKVSYEEVHAIDSQKFKRKGELVAYATKNPGALSAHFLASIYARLSKGRVERSSQLREANVVTWASQHSGLSEVRDVREVLTLAEAMDCINRREIERAMDILSQRILAIQQAKRKGGSWEKAEMIELIPSGTSLASSSMLALTN